MNWLGHCARFKRSWVHLLEIISIFLFVDMQTNARYFAWMYFLSILWIIKTAEETSNAFGMGILHYSDKNYNLITNNDNWRIFDISLFTFNDAKCHHANNWLREKRKIIFLNEEKLTECLIIYCTIFINQIENQNANQNKY